ncbi:MAG: TldD/PmbA family protein [Pyrinomonadaceae bacterium]
MSLTKKESDEITNRIMSFVDADDAEVSVRDNRSSNLRFANNQLLTSGSIDERSASVTVWEKGRSGSSSTTDLSDAGLKQMVRAAQDMAKISPVDREYLPTLGPQKYVETPSYAAASENVSLRNRAKSVGNVLDLSQKAGTITAGFHESEASATGFRSKNGNFGFEKESYASLSVTARTSDGRSSGYYERGNNDASKIDIQEIARSAIRKAVEGRDAKSLDPGIYAVVLEPQAVGDLIGNLGFQFDARRAEEGRSPFSATGGKTRLGEKVFDSKLDIYSDPWDPEVPASGIGPGRLPAKRVDLIKGGELKNLVYSRFWASKKEVEPTHGPSNLIMRSNKGVTKTSEMISATKRGLLISRFWYIRATDPRTASFTGLTRDGVWLIENGKISSPVNNFRFNQSVMKMLSEGNVDAIGSPERIGRNSLLPALLLKEFNFTSVSQAV